MQISDLIPFKFGLYSSHNLYIITILRFLEYEGIKSEAYSCSV
jgi:hypothetical protein